MTDWGKEVLQRLRLRKGLTQESLADAMGMSAAWVAKQEAKADVFDPPKMHAETFNKLASILGVSAQVLEGGTSKKPPPLPGKFIIPRVSSVAANDFREYPVDLMNEEGVPGQLYPYPAQDPHCLRVVGSSMVWDHPDAIYEGDDVIFANALEEEVPENAIVVARNPHLETQTVKRLHYLDGDRIELIPQNPTFPRLKAVRSEIILRTVKVIVHYPYKRK